MKSQSLSRRFVFLCSLVLLALPLQAATTRELDPLAGEVSAFASFAAPAGKTSAELARRIGWSEATARHEPDSAKREALLARLAALRQELEGVAQRLAAKNGSGGDEANGAFSGRVTDDGEPLADAQIEVYDSDGYYWTSTRTGVDGRYSLSLEPGTYFLYAEPPYGRSLSPQIFEGISCFLSSTCQITEGTPLTIASGGHRAADFALEDLGAIEGEVHRRDDATPVDTEIRVYDRDLDLINNLRSQQGSYRIGGLPPGEYWVVALGKEDLAGMLYDGIPCDAISYDYSMPCGTAGATRVLVELDGVATGIDFGLFRGATLRASIFDVRTGAPVEGYGNLFVFGAAGELKRINVGDGQREILVEGLAGGTYYASVEANRYTSQSFDRKDCFFYDGCRAAAAPIALALGEDSDLLRFPLNRRGSVAGRVIDDRSGGAIENVPLELIEPASGGLIASTRSDSAGFFSFSEVPALPVLLLARDDRYRSEYFDDVDAGRGPAAATPVSVRSGELITVEIGLQPRGALATRAVAAESGEPLACFGITAYPVAPAQERLSIYECPQDGQLTLRNVPPGQYRVVISSSGRADYLHGKGSCNWMLDQAHCNLGEGTVIAVGSGETRDLGDAELERSSSLRVELHFTAPSGYPHSISARALLYESSGALVRDGHYFQSGWAHFYGLTPGDYYLVADGSPYWQSIAYPDVLCSRWYCDPFRGSRILLQPGEQSDTVSQLGPSTPYNGCTASATTLCLNQGRYRVSATWRDFAGASGAGTARGLTTDSGYFYFFSPNNLEVLVKVLNGCAPHLGHHFWVYGAGLTNVQVQLRVEDTLTGAVELYSNALGSTFQPILDNAAFATCDAVAPQAGLAGSAAPADADPFPAAAAPEPSSAPMAGAEACSDAADFCLGGRFAVEATYRAASGTTGQGGGTRVTPDTGTFYFFDQRNVELVVKILDACDSALPGYWVFASGLTDVEVDLEITDKATGRSKSYHQPPGPFAPIIDLQSFPCE